MSKLYFRYATMSAGKSTAVLQAARGYEVGGAAVRLLTAKVDDRQGPGQIASQLGFSRQAEVFDILTDMGAIVRAAARDQVRVVLIDEAQFLTPEQVKALHLAAHLYNVPVMCYGLRTDFQGFPFPGSSFLMGLAEDIDEIRNVCTCGSKATLTIRLDANGQRMREGPIVLIGGSSRYRPVCGDCFYDIVKIPKTKAIQSLVFD